MIKTKAKTSNSNHHLLNVSLGLSVEHLNIHNDIAVTSEKGHLNYDYK